MIPHQHDLGTAPTTGSTSPPTAPANGSIGPVIDLRDAPTTRVRVARHDNPFTALSPPERMRLIIRVLCELVAYDELEGSDESSRAEEHQRTIRAAMDASEGRAARPGAVVGTDTTAPAPPATTAPVTPTPITG